MTITIASMPGSGTVMLAKAISGMDELDHWPIGPNDEINGVRCAHVPPQMLPHDGPCVYLFTDPRISVIYTLRKHWNPSHWRNCGWTHGFEPDIIAADELRYGMTLRKWTQHTGTLCVRYDAIWDYANRIKEHVGVDFQLPDRRPRLTTIDHPHFETIEKTYAALAEKVASLPNCWVVE